MFEPGGDHTAALADQAADAGLALPCRCLQRCCRCSQKSGTMLPPGSSPSEPQGAGNSRACPVRLFKALLCHQDSSHLLT